MIVKYQARDVDAMLLCYWLMYCRAPGRNTAPVEVVDLGEIGEVRSVKVERMTPYSPAQLFERAISAYPPPFEGAVTSGVGHGPGTGDFQSTRPQKICLATSARDLTCFR